MEDVISPPILIGALNRDHIEWLLDDTNPILAPRVGADVARVVFRRVEAIRAQPNTLLHGKDGLGETDRIVTRRSEHVVRQPGGGFRANPGKFGEFIDQAGYRLSGRGTGTL